uniref:Uncharacterized protein n=1 Tax=Arundo donax TaxID=35708 RepID=A0A0A8ZU03_ARUDO
MKMAFLVIRYFYQDPCPTCPLALRHTCTTYNFEVCHVCHLWGTLQVYFTDASRLTLVTLKC